MKIQSAEDILQNRLNSFVYSRPGGGKTKFLLQHPGPVLVDPKEQGMLTLREMLALGEIDFMPPVITIDNDQDLWHVTNSPEDIIAKIHELPGYKDYEVKTFGFENLTELELLLLGEPTRPAHGKPGDPDYRPEVKGSGIMGPTMREPGEEEIVDWKVLNRTMRGFFRKVREMPYNTVVTAHAEIAVVEEDSKKGLKVPDSQKTFGGFPAMTGKLRYSAGGLADFFIYMERAKVGGKMRYMAYTEPWGRFDGRTKIQNTMPGAIDWTGKNLYQEITGYLGEVK